MQTSSNRILTTHAGSLPRSDRLVALQTARFRGEPVDVLSCYPRIAMQS